MLDLTELFDLCRRADQERWNLEFEEARQSEAAQAEARRHRSLNLAPDAEEIGE